jgi:CrcB protein
MNRPPPRAPDGDASPDPQPARSAPPKGAVLGVISAGGVIGALARHQVGLTWPVPPAGFPWSTLAVNLSGCLLLGVLLTLLAERPRASPLLRPFLGTGILGGYTTFSAYTVDLHRLFAGSHPGIASAYLGGTLAGAVAATAAGIGLARRMMLR